MFVRFALLLVPLAVLALGCSDAPAPDGSAPEIVTRGGTSNTDAPSEDLYPGDPLSEALPAPRFELAGPFGTYALAEHDGDIVVLHFWATWNELSQDGLLALDSLHADLEGDAISFVGISEDEDGMPLLTAWTSEHEGLNFPLVADSAGSVAAAYGDIDLLPTTVVIDRQGIIRARHTGILTADEVLDLLGPILIEDDEPLSAIDVSEQPGVVQSIAADVVPEFVAEGAMLVDIRHPDERALDGAVPDAQHRPLHRLDPQDLPANFGVPVLFLGDSEDDTNEAAELALSWGYVAVYQVKDGLKGWREAGLPLQPLAPRQPQPVVRARTVYG